MIANAVDDVFTPDGPAAEGEYVLAVGTLEPRKNLRRVEEAAAVAGLELRVVGAPGWGDVARRELGSAAVGDEELARLYRGALCLVFPSLYEGFGIPVPRRWPAACPVVTSRGGAMAEIAGDAAVLVDPLDVESIAAGLREAIARATSSASRARARPRVHLGAASPTRRSPPGKELA